MKQYLRLDEKYIIKTYKTKTELEVLEFLSFNSFENDDDYEPAVDSVLEECVGNYDPSFPKLKKIILLWYIRIATLGDELDISFKCKECQQQQQLTVSLSKLFKLPSKFTEDFSPEFIDSSCPSDLTKQIDDEMDIEEYEDYFKNIVDYHIIYNNNFSFNCQYCEKENYTNLLTFKNALSFLSEDNFYTLTEWIHTLMYYDNCSRSDILEMSPIQRMLEINYFKETKKKETQNENI